jgi:uncharacterized protein with LGFP repeats
VHGAILVRYLEMGGPTSALGFPTTDEANTLAGGRSNGFQGGGIYWTPGTGAHEVYGEIGRLYRALGGPTSPLGFPTSGELGAPGGGGRLNEFQVGAIYWSPATGPHEIRGPMLDKYRSLGGPTSPLGFPTSDVHPVAGGIASSFQGGEIIFSGPTGAHEVHGAIGFVYWLTGSSGGFLGLPTTDETATPGGAGRFNGFQGGAVYWSPATGAHEVHGAIHEHYQALGGPGGFLGLPIDSERPVPGGAVSRFQGGSIFWSPATGAHELHGAILGAYMFMGGSSSFLGFPVTNETGTPDGVGRYNHFQNGSIYWTFATGAHEVHGAIRDFWANSFWEFGPLGYPTSSELPTPDGVGRFNRFQGGTVTWTPITGAFRS